VTPAPPAAVRRAHELLAPGHDAAAVRADYGYLDLLGDRAPPSTGPVQDLMLSRVVPLVYERWWRPALGRLVVGLRGPSMADEHRLARLLLGLRPGDRVLDVACGPGNFTRDFGRAVGEDGLALGIDASRTMLARAVRDTPPAMARSVGYVRADATRLPFRDGSFDAVCCFAALHLFADPFGGLDDMARVLAPGGRIAIFTSCRTLPFPLRPLEALAGAASGMRMFERGEVARELRRRGFGDVRERVTGETQFVGARLTATAGPPGGARPATASRRRARPS
jgi:ubiquinone/menaquinone biosynthesis C-methylase UbiE